VAGWSGRQRDDIGRNRRNTIAVILAYANASRSAIDGRRVVKFDVELRATKRELLMWLVESSLWTTSRHSDCKPARAVVYLTKLSMTSHRLVKPIVGC
jgi:hypothetical protein